MKLAVQRSLPVMITALLIAVGGYLTTSNGYIAPANVSIGALVPPNIGNRTADFRPTVKVNTSKPGTISIVDVGSPKVFLPPQSFSASELSLKLTADLSSGRNTVLAIVTYADGTKDSSAPFDINLDTEGPIVSSITATDGNAVEVRFKEPDVKISTITPSTLLIKQKVAGASPSLSSPISFKQPTTIATGNIVRLEFASKQPPGEYQCSVTTGLMDDLNIAAPAKDIAFRIPFTSADANATKLTPVSVAGVREPSPATNEYWLTRIQSLDITVAGIPSTQGKLIPYVNSIPQTATDSANGKVTVNLTSQGINTVDVAFQQSGETNSITLGSIKIVLDDQGPVLTHAELVERPVNTGMATTLFITFDADDIDSPKKEQFQVLRQGTTGEFDPTGITLQEEPVLEGRTVRLPVGTLIAGEYQLVVKGTLKDKAGNEAGKGKLQNWVFSSLASRKFGQHVEFTPYAPPQKQAIPKEGFNPADFVETRVARLYYYRDAHRVAEIINRNIRSYNQAAVTQAERRAEKSRDDANNSTDERRKSEREAVRSAEQARNAEQQLAAARETLAETQGLQNTVADEKAKLAGLTKDSAEAKKLQAKIDQEDAVLARFGGPNAIETLKRNITAMEQSVANLRQTELVKQEAAAGADAKESRAREKQFRDEVSAAETDPDTYVAGDMHSVDPVTQVSISVIGEGLIQLRGPVKGINKIRTMINEIDSPVGQIKIGIFTVQVNGEKGDKMEKVVGDAEGSIDLSRFLVNQSLNLLRRAIQSEAAMIAEQCEMEGHYQVDRDRRYLYSFFGRDFIDELYAMNSEFLNTENKLLSLHAMDTVSLNRALFILVLAKNDVRSRIVSRFLESTKTELADAEFDFRRSSELKPHVTEKHFPHWNRTHLPVTNHYHKEDVIFEAVHRNAQQRYHFRNFNGFFDTGFTNPDTMNPMQREFIRLAQIFKARLVAEMELKQRVLERGIIEDRSNDEDLRYELLDPVHKMALELERDAYTLLVEAAKNNQQAGMQIEKEIASCLNLTSELQQQLNQVPSEQKKQKQDYKTLFPSEANNISPEYQQVSIIDSVKDTSDKVLKSLEKFRDSKWSTDSDRKNLKSAIEMNNEFRTAYENYNNDKQNKAIFRILKGTVLYVALSIENLYTNLGGLQILMARSSSWENVRNLFRHYRTLTESPNPDISQVTMAYQQLDEFLEKELSGSSSANDIRQQLSTSYQAAFNSGLVDKRIKQAREISKKTRGDLDHRKLLNHLIDEQEDKFIELVEGVRSHIAVMDDYLKRLSIAIEDDFKVQFYDPMFVRVRDAARSQQVNLSQVERTTILTNNRAFAKVDPQATMEFDLPKRQIAIKEAFDAAKALVEDTGALVNDPTFLSAFQMMGGSKQPTTVKNVLPGQSQSTDQQTMGVAPKPQENGAPGSALQSLVPEPSIYKLETGTGFQIRPVMQPDGDSVVYDFDYMYTTNIREPVRADEKHIGRIKRHFVHTAVQTANFELREISRYQVALKVSRTSQGVPLLQDIPVLGRAFKPAPSAESSIQQNIILGQTNVYPTLFDLMGLRWAQQVVDLDHTSLMESEHVIRGRQKSMRDYVFGEASKRVDDFLNIQTKTPDSYRPDLYHPQTLTTPHHPGGYSYPSGIQDPTGNNFERQDARPADMQEPPYDRYRHQPASPERIFPQSVPERITPRSIPQSTPRSPLEIQPNAPSTSGSFNGSSRRTDPKDSPKINVDNATYRQSQSTTTGQNSIRLSDRTVVPASFERTERTPSNAQNNPQYRPLRPVRY